MPKSLACCFFFAFLIFVTFSCFSNTYCETTLESPQKADSNDVPQCMFYAQRKLFKIFVQVNSHIQNSVGHDNRCCNCFHRRFLMQLPAFLGEVALNDLWDLLRTKTLNCSWTSYLFSMIRSYKYMYMCNINTWELREMHLGLSSH